MTYSSAITPEKICALVKSELHLKNVALDESFHDLGCTNADLLKIQNRINKAFARTVSTIYFIDTVYSITERLTTKPNTHDRIKH